MVRPAMTSVRSRETGFALLEAVVAMAIAAIGLATVFRTIGDGLRTASRVQEVQAAINGANTLLPTDLPAPPIYAKVNPSDAPILCTSP